MYDYMREVVVWCVLSFICEYTRSRDLISFPSKIFFGSLMIPESIFTEPELSQFGAIQFMSSTAQHWQ